MAANLEAPTAEQVAAHYHQSLKRKRSARRLMWGMIFGLVLLAMLAPVALYIAWLAHGRALLREELVKIQSAGEPITTAEMTAWHQVPEGKRDITQLWLDAIRPFGTREYHDSCAGVPLVGFSRPPWVPPPLDQPLSAADELALRNWLTLHQDKLAAIYAAAREEGAVCYPIDFRKGAHWLTECEQLNVGFPLRALRAEFQILARESDINSAIDNIETRFAAAETWRNSPSLALVLERSMAHISTAHDLQALAATRHLDDVQLARLQTMLRKLELQPQLAEAIIGERAIAYLLFHQRWASDPQIYDREAAPPRETTQDISEVRRPEDCAMMLAMIARRQAVIEQPLFQAMAELQALADEEHRMAGPASLNRLLYPRSNDSMISLTYHLRHFAEFEATRNVADASLAVRRYHLRHNRLPRSLVDLVPDFLPHMPIDPFDGQSLRVTPQPDHVLLYSIGKDNVDDGGISDSTKRAPDIAVNVKPVSTR